MVKDAQKWKVKVDVYNKEIETTETTLAKANYSCTTDSTACRLYLHTSLPTGNSEVNTAL